MNLRKIQITLREKFTSSPITPRERNQNSKYGGMEEPESENAELKDETNYFLVGILLRTFLCTYNI